MRIAEVLAETGYRRSTLYDHMDKGLFPRPIRLGPKARGWVAEEVQAWRAARLAERDVEPTRSARPSSHSGALAVA
ncbi:MAG: helix-turn-helix transcriptional regulator [Salinarimonas sp.]